MASFTPITGTVEVSFADRWFEVLRPDPRTSKLSHLDRRIDELIAERERIASLPVDDFDDGAIVSFAKTFGGTTVYRYVGIKSGGDWFITGRNGMAQSWDGLLEFVESDGGTVDGLWFAPKLEQVT